jgi:hypothetical protein
MDYSIIVEYIAAIVYTAMRGLVFNVVIPIHGLVNLFT